MVENKKGALSWVELDALKWRREQLLAKGQTDVSLVGIYVADLKKRGVDDPKKRVEIIGQKFGVHFPEEVV